MRRSFRFIVALLSAMLPVSACTDPAGQEGSYYIVCHQAMIVHITPTIAVLAVGDSVGFQARFGTQEHCAPPAPDGAGQWRRSSADTAIVRVDAVLGMATAVAKGATYVRASHLELPFFSDSVAVQVTGP